MDIPSNTEILITVAANQEFFYIGSCWRVFTARKTELQEDVTSRNLERRNGDTIRDEQP
jgi:hypothetical protein